jgi:hypothetical protein
MLIERRYQGPGSPLLQTGQRFELDMGQKYHCTNRIQWFCTNIRDTSESLVSDLTKVCQRA